MCVPFRPRSRRAPHTQAKSAKSLGYHVKAFQAEENRGPFVLLTAILLVAAIALVMWAVALRAIRGSTLVGPWCWALASMGVSVVCLCAMQRGAATDSVLSSQNSFGFLAAITSFCPTMALLGARRPQHQAWNFVVLALWCVLVLPAIQATLLRPGEPVSVHGIFAWFFWILIVAELLNRCGTQSWLSGVLQSACETLFLAPHLPLLGRLQLRWQWSWQAAVLIQCLNIAVMGYYYHRTRQRPRDWTTLWLSFRDSFGVLWSLRVAERMNSAAELLHWPVRLTWNGFRTTTGASLTDAVHDTEKRAAFEQTLVNLLRRFLSDRAIDAGIQEPR